MKRINRDFYLKKLISRRGSSFIKIITGLRRSGKSYLLDPIFKKYLIQDGVRPDHIVKVNLDNRSNARLLDPDVLYDYILEQVKDEEMYYVLLDEIQMVPEFESVLNSFLQVANLDVYVTGSNSRFLSSDIVTEFRGRGEEIHMFPLSFGEFYGAVKNEAGGSADIESAWEEYYRYGGLPQIFEQNTEAEKVNFLAMQRKNVYLNDIVDRYKLRESDGIGALSEVLASAIGSPTNPHKLERTFKSMAGKDLSYRKIEEYLGILEDAFLIERARRFDVKGKRYIDTPAKYYFSDMGIRNSFLDFRQTEETHLMENVIYNELRRRGYQVDVGVVETREDGTRKQLEVDFVAKLGDQTCYIQSALRIGDLEKREQESRSLVNIDDHFSKIIVAKDTRFSGHEQSGIATIGLFEFLLNDEILEGYK